MTLSILNSQILLNFFKHHVKKNTVYVGNINYVLNIKFEKENTM